MVTGIEKGNLSDTFTWDGAIVAGTNLTVNGNLSVTGTASLGGSTLMRRKTITLTAAALAAASTTATSTGFTLPAGSIVQSACFVLTAADAGSSKSLAVGVTGASYNDFINGIVLDTGTSTGLITGTPTIATSGTNIDRMFNNDCKIGSNLCTFVAGVDANGKTMTAGFFIRKPYYVSSDTVVYFKLSAATTTAAGQIIIEYML